LAPKITKPNVIREKLLNLLPEKKCAHKMLMKLTPCNNSVFKEWNQFVGTAFAGGNLTNILV
jgi:hypothetical protein